MGREILFRGKCELSGLWNTGSLVKYKDDYGNEEYHIVQTDKGYVVVIPETVGQFTGLTDKNGKRIFEGDIVTGYFDHEKIIGYIFYGEDATFFIQRDGLYGIGLNNATDWLSVIGNIHDNPELLNDIDKPVSDDISQPVLQPATPENFELRGC